MKSQPVVDSSERSQVSSTTANMTEQVVVKEEMSSNQITTDSSSSNSSNNRVSFDLSYQSPSKGGNGNSGGSDLQFMEINPLAVKQGKIRTPEDENNASRNIDRFLQKLTPNMRQDMESYVDFKVDEKRSIDRQTIRELVEEIKHLTLKVEGIHGFNEFVSGSDVTVNEDFDTNDKEATGSDVHNNNDVNDVIIEANNMPQAQGNKSGSKNRKDAESTSKALWSFMYGAICMLICVYIEHLRSSYIHSRKLK